MKVEILAGGSIQNAFKALNIEAKRTYKGTEKEYYQSYEIWEIEKSDMHKLEETEWLDEYGWWRYAKGSNMGTAYGFFTVNGKELIAWDGYKREDLRDEWYDEPDEEKAEYHYSFKEYEEAMYPRDYMHLTEYMCQELGASQPKNICALAVDLARSNGLTMAQLFEKYEG